MYNEEIAPRLRSGTALGYARGPPLAAFVDRPWLRSGTALGYVRGPGVLR
jgi:hypothetical protein